MQDTYGTWTGCGLLISGGETELDKSIVRKIGDPDALGAQLLDHGIEAGGARAAGKNPARLSRNATTTTPAASSRSGGRWRGFEPRQFSPRPSGRRGLVDAEDLSDGKCTT